MTYTGTWPFAKACKGVQPQKNHRCNDLQEQYNHYYTDTIKKRRREREEKVLANRIDNATQHIALTEYHSYHTSAQVDSNKAAREYSDKVDPNMENHSCQEALDCLHSIYKVSELVVRT